MLLAPRSSQTLECKEGLDGQLPSQFEALSIAGSGRLTRSDLTNESDQMVVPTISEEANELGGSVAEELARRLRQFNERAAGPLNSKPIVLALRNEGALIGGLAGELFWNALFVDLLWVDESHRQRSYGGALLRRAEAIAEKENREWVYLSTFAFQAPSFYARRGYELIGELDDVPRGSKRQWFRKAIVSRAV